MIDDQPLTEWIQCVKKGADANAEQGLWFPAIIC